MASTSAPKQKQPPTPLIPEKYLDVPSQRLYYLSLGLLCQSIKIIDFLWSITSSADRHAAFRKWLLFDFIYCILLSQLRIPRLTYSKANVLLQIAFLWFLDGVMFGGISVDGTAFFGTGLSFSSGVTDISASTPGTTIRDIISLVSLGLIAAPSATRDAHLLGQHTVRMSPISTAHLNPQGQNFCLSPTSRYVFIPVVLNNTNIAGLRYSVTPLGNHAGGKLETHDMSLKDLKSVEQSYLDKLQLAAQPSSAAKNTDDYDEYDDDDDSDAQKTSSSLQKTQSLYHIMLSKPGIVRLERVYDSSNTDARLVISQAVVVPCPRVEFGEDEKAAEQPIRCVGQDTDVQLKINVNGVPPLSLKWMRTVNGVREEFLVEGIEGDQRDAPEEKDESSPYALSTIRGVAAPQNVMVPLSVTLERPGTYLYALEEIMDGVGNSVKVGTTSNEVSKAEPSSFSKTQTTRSFMILRKPAVSFSRCTSDNALPLLIGSETPIDIRSTNADELDGPWDISLSYSPNKDDGDNKKLKPWNKVLKATAESNGLTFRAAAPGEYKINGIKGKYCVGTVLAPDACKVVQTPLPSAEIKWKRIHECSGDTGVSATLILHGTPPFQVFYKTQLNNESPRELSKTFTSSRAEMTFQPERSGRYVLTFVAISDSNYNRIELNGPTIDQVIHPVASADFSKSHGVGRGKKLLSTCSGDSVDIGVDLKGTGPWNLEIQVIGPHQVETMNIQDIKSSHKKIQIPIPKSLQKSGGSFEINLVSVEDASKCKRPVSVPGIEVKVKRTIPTVKFYGTPSERRAVITENERANLPLRLTGDGSWRVKYRRQGSDHVMTSTIHDRNGHLSVAEQGVYELVEISDNQCPGQIVQDASTYTVEWISRPVAKLAPSTNAVYEPHNGSYILPPICEGMNDHVDLELTGRPPFQIMYNIAQDNELGGTRIIDQPTFNSIQPRTRFQLQTSTPGRMYYEVKQIGDTAYPLSKNRDVVIPRDKRLLFEQQVSVRPSARFKNRNRMVYCLNDALTPLDLSSSDGVVIFEGTPPFKVTLSVKNIAASHIDTQTIDVSTNTWRLDLPNYHFHSIGPHLVSIEAIVDASGCEQAALDPLFRFVWVDVAESASIIPFERREDVCVGDLLQFQLEGIPPWTIGYKVNGKSYTQEAKTSPLSLVQQQPGLFTVTSIAHQQKMCKAAVTDLRYQVHALPSAQVGHGKKIFQDIHEGDQAEIVFTLIGEPPFTFTYQRSELSPKKGVMGRVLETHTVSRINTREYSIFSALEGTWTVTSISDRYCRYPPVQPDLALEKK
ncbi:hypothetical protein CVT24_005335 [Panaeolus cyanescens]|uniref:Ig-like domain-containing protein n=1 Tax=Panaeolus cyanescens TaxID=181874 RepID=A0A409Y9A4_9AGAR|nr:hypothetical protein CVT24_005335 [Panaeolus cyanescens]